MPLSQVLMIGPEGRIMGDIAREIERVEQTLVDLRYLADGHYPAAENLEKAPLLEDWALVPRPVSALNGNILGHPHVREGGGTTSPLLILAADMGWARTESRLYRLGERRRK